MEVTQTKRARPLLGTLVEISATGDSEILNDAVSAAFFQIEKIHRLLSRFEPESDISRINQTSPETVLLVNPSTYHVLDFAVKLYGDSLGVFDPCVGGIGTIRSLKLEGAHRLRTTHPLSLDLGGVAKGFAVDSAVECLIRSGVQAGIVNAGGDIRVFGPEPHQVQLRDPRSPGECSHTITLNTSPLTCAVATSAPYFSEDFGAAAPVLKNPNTGEIMHGSQSVSVLAPQCIIADAMTKVVAFMNPRELVPVLDRYHATVVTYET